MKIIILIIPIILLGIIIAQAQTVVTLSADQPAELKAHAGSDTSIFLDNSVLLGEDPSATGGTEPYNWFWSDGIIYYSKEANPLVTLERNTTYSLVVTDNRLCTSKDEIIISINTTGINDFHEDVLQIYPIPATGKFTVEYNGGICKISLIDENGRLLWTKQLNGKSSFAAPPNPGVYFLKINDGDTEVVKTIIISQ